MQSQRRWIFGLALGGLVVVAIALSAPGWRPSITRKTPVGPTDTPGVLMPPSPTASLTPCSEFDLNCGVEQVEALAGFEVRVPQPPPGYALYGVKFDATRQIVSLWYTWTGGRLDGFVISQGPVTLPGQYNLADIYPASLIETTRLDEGELQSISSVYGGQFGKLFGEHFTTIGITSLQVDGMWLAGHGLPREVVSGQPLTVTAAATLTTQLSNECRYFVQPLCPIATAEALSGRPLKQPAFVPAEFVFEGASIAGQTVLFYYHCQHEECSLIIEQTPWPDYLADWLLPHYWNSDAMPIGETHGTYLQTEMLGSSLGNWWQVLGWQANNTFFGIQLRSESGMVADQADLKAIAESLR